MPVHIAASTCFNLERRLFYAAVWGLEQRNGQIRQDDNNAQQNYTQRKRDSGKYAD